MMSYSFWFTEKTANILYTEYVRRKISLARYAAY